MVAKWNLVDRETEMSVELKALGWARAMSCRVSHAIDLGKTHKNCLIATFIMIPGACVPANDCRITVLHTFKSSNKRLHTSFGKYCYSKVITIGSIQLRSDRWQSRRVQRWTKRKIFDTGTRHSALNTIRLTMAVIISFRDVNVFASRPNRTFVRFILILHFMWLCVSRYCSTKFT